MKKFLKAVFYAVTAFTVGTIGTLFAFAIAVKWLVHTEPGVGKVYGAGFPSVCVGVFAMIGTFLASMKRSRSPQR